MSTRCQILVEGNATVFYRHSDGYPERKSGVLHDILPLVKAFTKVSDDPDYLMAHIVHHLPSSYLQLMEGNLSFCGDEVKYINYGIEGFEGVFYSDSKYIYIVNKNSVEIHKANSKFWDNPVIESTDIISVVDFDGKEIVR
jgi:hypothetical protein